MRNILVIDSNTDYHLLVKRKLCTTKYSVLFAQDLTDARNNLELYSFNLIIISHIMKNSSGEVVMGKLRDFGYQGPILVTTSDPQSKETYEHLSAAAVIDKCTNKEDFIKVVRSVMTTQDNESPTPQELETQWLTPQKY